MDVSGMQLRALRAAIFTALVVTLSAASHVLLSRVPLPLTTVAGLSAGVFAVAYALCGRERGYWRIAGLLVPLELAADTVFTTGQDVCYGPGGGPVAGSLRTVGFDVLCGGSVGTALPGVGGPDHGTEAALLHSANPAMPWLLLAAHLSLGLLAAAWLRRGESALAGLVRAVGAFAFRPLMLAAAVVVTAHRSVRRAVRPALSRPGSSRTRLLVHSVGRRGPPRSAAVFA
ncbi:hypothetical protein [Streptomyces sp.]|uniref:hypothetical protein n=1 Tax=Streptomyces sp. TaxID=1931 RepID=UPI002D764D0D|nr:hypothetical protein [Streptomyces sp.]HET6359535.1 hypothetical protein [Streptomyces sp.]